MRPQGLQGSVRIQAEKAGILGPVAGKFRGKSGNSSAAGFEKCRKWQTKAYPLQTRQHRKAGLFFLSSTRSCSCQVAGRQQNTLIAQRANSSLNQTRLIRSSGPLSATRLLMQLPHRSLHMHHSGKRVYHTARPLAHWHMPDRARSG